MRHRQQGSVLISVIVLLIIASFAALALTISLQDYGRMQGRTRDELQAFYSAEAGINEVISWFNTSGTVILAQAPSLAPLFKVDSDLRYSLLANQLHAGDIDVAHYDSTLLPVLRDTSGRERGRVTSLKITTATLAEQAEMPYLICVINTQSKSQKGSLKGIRLYCSYQRLVLDGAPGVIESHGGAALGGNAKGHWGEVWAHNNMNVANKSQVQTQSQDPWLKFRAEGYLVFPNNWGPTKWFDQYGILKPILAGSDTTVDPTNPYPCQGVVTSNIGTDYGTMMQQNQTLRWPSYPYSVLKKIALMKGRYYSTDASGNVYRSGIEDAAHRISSLTELNVGGSRSNWANVNPDVVFVDTIDGQEPAADGSNITTLRMSGSGFSWKGFYYIAANLDLSGMGNPSAVPCKDPTGVVYNLSAFMDGMLVIKGWASVSGNPCVYGSAYIERGLTGTGTMDCWYNVDLRNGGPKFRSNVEATRYLVLN
jgi:hypothetical protein